MKRFIYIIALCSVAFIPLHAQQAPVTAQHLHLQQQGDELLIRMDLNLAQVEVGANRVLLITPCLAGKTDSVELAPVGIYSRSRYYYYQRMHAGEWLGGPQETVIRRARMPRTQAYEAVVPFESWMEGADLQLLCQEYGCCNSILGESRTPLATYRSRRFRPVYVYHVPQELPVQTLSGTAYIHYPVNRTGIRPDFGGNRAELQKITSVIDSVQGAPGREITAISISGYASPEGSYRLNTRLAEGRTRSLCDYVNHRLQLPGHLVSTASVPEDWEGVRRYVAQSALPHRAEMLHLLDSVSDPDARDRRLRALWPDEYRRLLRDCYPTLRRSDYRVDYVVRPTADAAAIRQKMQQEPQQVSLAEYLFLAATLQPGSYEFDELFETAVHLYPADETVHVNAAVIAMRRGDLTRADRYLQRAGHSRWATYARGIHAALQQHYAEARTCFEQARSEGMPEAAEALEQLDQLEK